MSDIIEHKKNQIIVDRHKGLAGRIIYQPRPRAESIDLVPTKIQKPHGNQKFQNLPLPSGSPPYHLKLDEVLSTELMDNIKNAGRIIFHSVGDTGGIGHPLNTALWYVEKDR